MTDPYRVLGVPESADDAAVRAAYLGAIRDCPPERDRQRFEQVRAAYEALANARARAAHALFDSSEPTLDGIVARLAQDWQPGRPTEAALRRVLARDA